MNQFRAGFTLVELSIVLVILGLLVGGVLTGQSLIRASELRAVTSEHSSMVTATNTFKDKYFAIPGDMTNATSFWGTNAGCATAVSGTGTQTCNGNGDGLISTSMFGGIPENWYFWQHLSNAGLITGKFSGVGSTYYSCDSTRCPSSKMSGAGWAVVPMSVDSGVTGSWWTENNRTIFSFGNMNTVGFTGGGIINSEEAWNIDTKVDDGMPGLGVWRSWGVTYNWGCVVTAAGVIEGSNYTKVNAPNLFYNLKDKGKYCGFQIASF